LRTLAEPGQGFNDSRGFEDVSAVELIYDRLEGIYLRLEQFYFRLEGIYLRLEQFYLRLEGIYLRLEYLY